jgi:hypothetical protein
MVQSVRLLGLFVLLSLGLLFVSVKPAWGNTVTPSSPTAGVSFNISGNEELATEGSLAVYDSGGCGTGIGNSIFSTLLAYGPYNVTVPGQPAGQYSAEAFGDSPGCVDFTINPAVTTATSAAASTPGYVLALPVLAVLMIIGYGLIRARKPKLTGPT